MSNWKKGFEGEGDTGGHGSDGRDATSGSGSSGGEHAPLLCRHTDTDSECGTCRKGHCCDEIFHCHDAPGCFCFWSCLAHDEDTMAGCHMECEYDGGEWGELLACQAQDCESVCTDGTPTDLPPTD